GRGWLSYELAVDIEPPFHPFFGHKVDSPAMVDDGKSPGIFSRLVSAILPTEPPPPVEEEREIILPFLFDCEERIQTFSLVVPKGSKIGVEETEQLLVMLSNCRYPVSFEIIASSSSISL